MLRMFYFWLFLRVAILSLGFKSLEHRVKLLNLSLSGSFWEFVRVFDLFSFGILLMLFICFNYAYFYTGHYFSGDLAGVQLNYIICLFVGVMATLVLTGDFLRTLILWEYLGVVRFFLILFYSKYLSLRSSVVTLVSSRFGDVCLFFLIAVRTFKGLRLIPTSILLFFIIFTKSASFPFISWLLEAMRAPTPVRSLVHSSTLVAAGVWFSLRYDLFLFFERIWFFYILLLLTIFITGLCCFFFLDLKKIVALSTCKNISWCLVYLIFGDILLSLFQLVSHGVSKCLLFMLVGDVMRGAGGSQARKCVYSPRLFKNLNLFGLYSVVLGLSGAPFIGVFFTKHFLLTKFYSVVRLTCLSFVSFCVFLSYFYSFRLCRLIRKVSSRISCGVYYCYSSGLMVYFWLIIKYFISSCLDELYSLPSSMSKFLIFSQLLSLGATFTFFGRTLVRKWRRRLFGCDKLVELCYSMFYGLKKLMSIFFFRWDNYSLNLFSLKKGGNSTFMLFNYNLLNLIMMMLGLILLSWCLIF